MNCATRFGRNGYDIVENAMGGCDLVRMTAAFPSEGASPAVQRQTSMTRDFIGWLRAHLTLGRIASRFSEGQPILCRVIAFDKTAETNWFVPWHQDRAGLLAERAEIPGFGPWSVKEGCCHAELPVPLLESMVTVRIHLDECGAENGPLEVVPGSHVHGRLDRRAIEGAVARGGASLCVAKRGDILAMRPLIVHRSRRAIAPGRRRVLHLEYAAPELPDGLRWALEGSTAP